MSSIRTRKSKHQAYSPQTKKEKKKKKKELLPEERCPYCEEKIEWVLRVNVRGKAKMVSRCKCNSI